jgi:putative flippase GtrA
MGKSNYGTIQLRNDKTMATHTITQPSKEITRFARFLTVGAFGTALDFGLLAALKLAGLPTILANSISFTAGVANNFTFNSLWTFSDRRNGRWQARFFQFLLVSLVGLALNNAIVLLLEMPLGAWIDNADFGYAPAKVIATGVVVFWNYFANRNWTFKYVAALSGGACKPPRSRRADT